MPRHAGIFAEALADGRAGRSPQLAGQALRHDPHRPQAVDIRPREIAPGDDSCAGGMEITGRDIVVQAQGRFFAFVVFSFDVDLIPVRFGSAHGNGSGEACGGNAGNRGQLVLDAVLHPHDCLRIANQRLRNRNAHHLQRCGIGEARIDVAHRLEGADHQHGADEQHQRHGYLRHDQQVAAALPLAAYACRSHGTEQRHGLPRRSITQHRNGAEEQPGEHRENQGECERPAVERDLAQTRQILRPNRRQQAQSRIRNSHADCSAQQAKRHALQQQLARNPPSSRAERRADRKLLLAPIGAYQQQVGHVGARDQHHHADRRHHHPQHVADAADHLLLQRLKRRRDLPVQIKVRIAAWTVRPRVHPDIEQTRHIGVGLRDRNARPEPRDAAIGKAGQ